MAMAVPPLCPECSMAFEPAAKFCGNCGANLRALAEAAARSGARVKSRAGGNTGDALATAALCSSRASTGGINEAGLASSRVSPGSAENDSTDSEFKTVKPKKKEKAEEKAITRTAAASPCHAPSPPRYVSSVREWLGLMQDFPGKVVAVQFTASWCGPCKMIGPVYEALALKHHHTGAIVCRKVDADEHQAILDQCKVTSMPSFQFFKDGQKLSEFTGNQPDLLKFHMDMYASGSANGASMASNVGAPTDSSSKASKSQPDMVGRS